MTVTTETPPRREQRWTQPAIILTFVGWVFMAGIQVAMFWALQARVDALALTIEKNVRSRAEGDEIIRRFDLLITQNTGTLADHELRIRVLEARIPRASGGSSEKLAP